MDPETTPIQKKSFSKIFLIIFGIIIGFLLLIASDRLLGLVLYKFGYFTAMMPNTSIVYTSNEFSMTYKLSNQGLRNDVVTVPKPKNTYRILALGDSFTFGWGVKLDETWPKLLEKSLVIPGKKVEIVNAAVPGFQLPGEIEVCKTYADKFDSDAILVGIHSDDFPQEFVFDQIQANQTIWETLFPTLFKLRQPIIEDQIWRTDPIPHKPKIYASDSWKQSARDEQLSNPDAINRLDPQIRSAFLDGKLDPMRVIIADNDKDFLTHILNPSYFSQTIASYNTRLQQFRSECGKDRPVIFVLLPASELVSQDVFAYKKAMGFSVDPKLTTLDFDAPIKRIVQNNGYTYLSVLSEFRKRNCIDCYYNYDGHFTPKGHEITAQIIAPTIEAILEKKK